MGSEGRRVPSFIARIFARPCCSISSSSSSALHPSSSSSLPLILGVRERVLELACELPELGPEIEGRGVRSALLVPDGGGIGLISKRSERTVWAEPKVKEDKLE